MSVRPPYIALLLACAITASCSDSPRVDGLDFPVTEPGPYAVGFRTFEVTYDPPDGGPARTIPVAMWYPADARKTAALAEPARPTYLYIESTVAIVDAPVAAPAYEGGFPVVVHSHGHWAWESHSYLLGEGLAPLGVVFIAPGHIGDRIVDINTMNDDVDDFYERVYDIHETLDLLEELQPSDPMHGKCNTTRVVMTGHSRGTATVWATLGATIDRTYVDSRCANGDFDQSTGCPASKLAVYDRPMRDLRVVGGIPMAGNGDWEYFGMATGMSDVGDPVLMMSASFNVVGDAEILGTVHGPPLTWVEFAGGCHDLFGTAECAGDIDNAIALPAIRAYVYAFARRQILDDTSPAVTAILDGTTSLTSIVTFRSQ